MRSNTRLRPRLRFVAAAACTLAFSAALGSLPGCFDDDPAPAVHPATVRSTGVASPQATTQSGPTVVHVQDSPSAPPQPAPAPPPTVINNNVVPTPAPAPAPTAAPQPAPGTTVNVQPKTVNVP